MHTHTITIYKVALTKTPKRNQKQRGKLRQAMMTTTVCNHKLCGKLYDKRHREAYKYTFIHF
ncbi:hypothetical protein CVS40_2008 [Lucilia cuprina]|nr:hypothetical protein CVS40_2008 [Lucilia cuprina]